MKGFEMTTPLTLPTARTVPAKAKAVRFDQYGGTDVLYLADVDVPQPVSSEVLVAVRAAGTNPGEASIRQGYLDKAFPATFPSGPVSYTHLRAHETRHDLVCRLL